MIATYRPSALDTMKKELSKVQRLQNECVTEDGRVSTSLREEYNILTIKAKLIKESIDYLEELRSGR